MKKTNLILLSVLSIIALTVWFNCNPSQNYGRGSTSGLNELDESDLIKATATTNVWTWVSGSDTKNQTGVYGTKGIASQSNIPGARYFSISFKDSKGNFWLFGGQGLDGSGQSGYLNDLWKFDGSAWTWVSGSNMINQKGVYGTKGVASATNVPPAKYQSIGWIDGQDNIWIFGGLVPDDTGNPEDQIYTYATNDLWKFDGTNWTWVKGSNLFSQPGICVTKGVPGSANTPGARNKCTGWVDQNGSLWLFGGYGRGVSTSGTNNDLWKFDGTNWTWVAGNSDTLSGTWGTLGIYGTKGVASAASYPGSRHSSTSSFDSNGNSWMFGGWIFPEVLDPVYEFGSYGNDLWKFDGSNWTWMSGSNNVNSLPNYGTKGIAAAGNVPGFKIFHISWTDGSNNFWLFGGYGAGATSGCLNDLWKFDGTSWTWVSGGTAGTNADIGATKGIYGTKGMYDSSNVPGAREGSIGWADSYGNLWLFGGYGTDKNGTSLGFLNDLWMYKP